MENPNKNLPFEIDPQVLQALLEWQEASTKQWLAYREQILKFAAIVCTCTRRFDLRRAEEAVNCSVHGQIMWDPFTEGWL